MKISGFTIGKNISKLYYPMKESILSILPVVDEFIVVLGDCDPDDTTRETIESIGSKKIKIIDSVWDTGRFQSGTIYAQQTHLAKKHCTGDWLFYIQADEVVHEKFLPVIQKRCREFLDDREVEGLLFKYIHFWGDYWHYHDSHGWYRNEIRIIRNDPEIIPWRDAQSFRRIPGFDGINYSQQKNTFKLKVADIDAWIYHYGWVRPPRYMKSKSIVFRSHYRDKDQAVLPDPGKLDKMTFDYGLVNRLPVFKGTHPAVLSEKISKFDWKDQLQFSGKRNRIRPPHKHEKFRYRFVSFIEKYLLFGSPLGEFKNYKLIRKFKARF
jgi:hypothetical protein